MKRFISSFLIIVMCIMYMPQTYAQRDVSKQEILAQELKELELFRGVSETNFALDREPTRVEALVMLIRVLGKENEALDGSWQHPFTDVPDWADGYVGYAYSNGLTNGEEKTKFGTGDANAAMYLTFVLRSLGYSDKDSMDFNWEDPFTLSRETGILTPDVNTNEFWRADVVLVSHAALSAYLKNSKDTLAQKLISEGVFTQSRFLSVYNKGSKKEEKAEAVSKSGLTAEEIYAKCSPAVFFVVTFDPNYELYGTGSGFFIDDKGTAITNYHVIRDTYAAAIQLSDTEEVYEILGVYDYNVEEDWAVIQVDCTGNKYLNIGDVSKIKGGTDVYAIGSHEGLQNTISKGIVSNPARTIDDVTYIQTDAAISHGSSGGALLNNDGEVIGITSAGLEEGQNLNFVIPITYIADFAQKEVATLPEIYSVENGSEHAWVDDGRRKMLSYMLLRAIVTTNYQTETDDGGYEFRQEYDKDGGEGYDSLALTYYPDEELITVEVIDFYYGDCYFSYYFYVDSIGDETSGIYEYYSRNKKGKYELVAEGFTNSIICGEFNDYYKYEFSKYDGDNKEDDQKIAKIMHKDGLDFINHLFYVYEQEIGIFSVGDLGYSSY